jgi:hypothetical protein
VAISLETAAAFPGVRARGDRDAFPSASGRGAAQKAEIVVHQDRQVHLIVAGRNVPVQVAADASAAQAAGRLDAILGWHPAVVRDCPSASGRGFLSAMALTEYPVLPVLRAVQLLSPERQPLAASRTAVRPREPRVARARSAEWV